MTYNHSPHLLPRSLGEDLTPYIPLVSKAAQLARENGHEEFSDQLDAFISVMTTHPIAAKQELLLPEGWGLVPRNIRVPRADLKAMVKMLPELLPSRSPKDSWSPAVLRLVKDHSNSELRFIHAGPRPSAVTLTTVERILKPPFQNYPFRPEPMTQGVQLASWAPYVHAIDSIVNHFGLEDDWPLLIELLEIFENYPVATESDVVPPPCWWVIPNEIRLGSALLHEMVQMYRNLGSNAGLRFTFGADKGFAYKHGSFFALSPYAPRTIPDNEEDYEYEIQALEQARRLDEIQAALGDPDDPWSRFPVVPREVDDDELDGP